MTELYVDSGLKEFASNLDSVDSETFIRVLNYMQSMGSSNSVSNLEHQVEELKKDIRAINKKRQSLRSAVEELTKMLSVADDYIEKNSSTSVLLLSIIIRTMIRDIEDTIAGCYPDNLLKKKATLVRKLENSREVSNFAKLIIDEIR